VYDAHLSELHGDDVAAVEGVLYVSGEDDAVRLLLAKGARDEDSHAGALGRYAVEGALLVGAEGPEARPDAHQSAAQVALSVPGVAERRSDGVAVELVVGAGAGGLVEAGAVELEGVLDVGGGAEAKRGAGGGEDLGYALQQPRNEPLIDRSVGACVLPELPERPEAHGGVALKGRPPEELLEVLLVGDEPRGLEGGGDRIGAHELEVVVNRYAEAGLPEVLERTGGECAPEAREVGGLAAEADLLGHGEVHGADLF
jgi:hypothetical protein